MEKAHIVENLKITADEMCLKIDGKQHSFKISEISQRLKNATQKEREYFEICPTGYGIHWPLIDEDLSIDGLLGIKHEPKKLKTKETTSK
ncbi:MAG: DUF2442 domain-containing protein [Planctomycetes bacterium]|nr:DUF2442 domain-containing protein [Planctomycetota bacterium]